jgi:hypothetical protein
MKQRKLFVLPLLALTALLAVFVTAYADDSNKDKLGPYKQLTTITIPEGLVGFDISWVDSESGRYYLANRGNAKAAPPVAPTIDVIDTEHDKFLFAIPLPLTAAGNGVVAIRKSDDADENDEGARELWVGAADSTVRIIDLNHPLSTAFSVSTGGTNRADELANDPLDHIILIANDQDATPFVTFISTKTRTVLGTLSYPQVVFLDPAPKSVNHGLEQPVWDGLTKRFYLSVPATSANHSGEVDEINPLTRMVTRIFPTTCRPAGLALIPAQHLMTSCGDVLDIATGSVVHTVPGVGADEIWFNPGDERVYFGGFVSVPVVSAQSPYSLIGTLPWVGTFVFPPPPPPAVNKFSHSIAADSENNHIFLPVTNVGVLVFTDDRDNGEGSDN